MLAASNRKSTALRALRVLELISESSGGVTVAEVARGIGADRSTAYRMLVTLVDAGYVGRDEAGTLYRLASKVLWLARPLLAERNPAALIEAELKALAEETGETVHYSVLQGDVAVISHKARGRQRVSVDTVVGDRSPLHATSAGKVLLAFGAPELTERVLAQGLPARARNTITSANALHSEVSKVRRDGYALDLHEFADDMRCVAAPVFGPEGLDGVISFSGPDTRFSLEFLEGLRTRAMAGAARLTSAMGGATFAR